MFIRFIAVLFLFALPANAQYRLSDGSEVAPLEMFQECPVCPEMIVLPLGDFMMGGPIGDSRERLILRDGVLAMAEIGDPAIGADERPVHRVAIDLPIAMGRDEVTRGQWMACVEDGGCGGHVPLDHVWKLDDQRRRVDIPVSSDNHPVIDVSVLDALAYVAWLNGKVGAEVYRLPTEAEWEYAARAGTQTRFAQGDVLTPDQANFLWKPGAERFGGVYYADVEPRRAPVPVDELNAANPWGLRHMSGNVIEQTRSCYTSRYEGWPTSSEWLRQSQVNSCERIFRGGGYNGGMDAARVASRGSGDESYRSKYSGFRIVRRLD